LGQDRELSDDDKRFILNTVKNYKELWEKIEHENLLKDRNRKLKIMELDKDFLDADMQKLLDEEERYVEEIINSREDLFDDEIKDIIARDIRINFIGRMFKDKEEWR